MISKIAVPNEKGMEYVNLGDIIYFEATSRYTKVVCKDRTILSSYNIGKFREWTDNTCFFAVHRSYLVNLNHIKRYENPGIVVMTDGSEIPVARGVKEEFLEIFNKI